MAHHQPHPPGYPVFIAAAKAMHAVMPSEAKAIALLGVIAAALGIIAAGALARAVADPDERLLSVFAPLFVATAPLYWFTAARPLSDSVGLAAALAIQALTIRASSSAALATAALLAGFAAGIRSQVLWLTVPLLAWRLRPGGPGEPRGVVQAFRPASAFVAGIALWFVPLLILSGGPAAYWRALFDQGAEDLSGITMLWTQPNVRTLVAALYYGFVAPWGSWPFAAIVLLLALAGCAVLARTRPTALAMVAIAYGPYLAFDILFQETFTVRYALPLVVPVAMFLAAAITALPPQAALAAAIPIAMFGAHVGGRSIADYSREPAPVFRMLDDMRRAGGAPVLAPDRRASFDLRRPLAWLAGSAPAFARQLPSPPQHEWLEAVKYWNDGGRAPVWFVVDPKRRSIDLVQHEAPSGYRYALPYPVLMSGTRPADMDWYRVERPDWYVGEGWDLTPESAGVRQADRRGLVHGSIEGRVATAALSGGTIVLGGRNFDPTLRPRITIDIGGAWRQTFTAESGEFLRTWRLPFVPLDPRIGDYARVAISADPAANVAIEQFDASAARPLLGFGSGWHERELDPRTGAEWRWLSDRGEIVYTSPRPAVLVLSGEAPEKYYAKPSRIVVRSGNVTLRDVTLSGDFSLIVNLPAAMDPTTIVIETDQFHVPAERRTWRRVADRRRLGLKIYSCAFVDATASSPGTAASFQPAR